MQNSVDVVLRLVEPTRSLALPSSAVMVGEDGTRTCVWALSQTGYNAVEVEVVGGTLGTVDVIGNISDSQILVNPLDILGEATCP